MDNDINESVITFGSILDYIKENIIGLSMFILVFFIIYVVDHINRINSIIFATPSSIPSISTSIPIKIPKIPKINLKGRKHKKY